MEKTISFGGDSNIGIFSRVFDDIAVIPPAAPEDFRDALTEVLGVDLVVTTIQGSEIVGSLLTGNNRGFVMSGLATDPEVALLREYREVYLLERNMNAAGNIILTTDSLTDRQDLHRNSFTAVLIRVQIFPKKSRGTLDL